MNKGALLIIFLIVFGMPMIFLGITLIRKEWG